MHRKLRQFSRQVHLWLAAFILIPSVIVIGSGVLLQIKKQSDWIQPPTQKGQSSEPSIAFDELLLVIQSVPELEATSWAEIDRLDVRPGKGIIKVLGNNDWEVQVDAQNGNVLQVAFRRSDTIEAIHDGSWFAEPAKLWLFLPAGVLLFLAWCSGCILLYTTMKSKYKKRATQNQRDMP